MHLLWLAMALKVTTKNELDTIRFQGKRVAEITRKLVG